MAVNGQTVPILSNVNITYFQLNKPGPSWLQVSGWCRWYMHVFYSSVFFFKWTFSHCFLICWTLYVLYFSPFSSKSCQMIWALSFHTAFSAFSTFTDHLANIYHTVMLHRPGGLCGEAADNDPQCSWQSGVLAFYSQATCFHPFLWQQGGKLRISGSSDQAAGADSEEGRGPSLGAAVCQCVTKSAHWDFTLTDISYITQHEKHLEALKSIHLYMFPSKPCFKWE